MSKLKTLNFLEEFSKKAKAKGKKIVLCHGAFDFLHLGHIKHFQVAKQMGDYLIVSITSDSKIQKGLGRPLYKERERVEFLSSISIIDYLYIDHNYSAVDVISKIKPNFYAKGADYINHSNDFTGQILKEKNIVKKYSGKLVFTDEQTFSASSIINQLTLNKEMITLIKKIKRDFSFEKVNQIINKLKDKKILIIGDTIIDEYVYVSTLGKPSKETIIASLHERNKLFLGGIFASVGNVSAFCNNVDFITTIGKENKYTNFIKKNIPKNVKKKLFFKSNIVTTKKTRFVEKGHAYLKKLFEVYDMEDKPISETVEYNIIKYLNKNLSKYDIVVVNDYGHGFLSQKMIDIICKKSKFLAVNVQINAGNQGYNLVTKYKKAKYYSLDMLEARRAINDKDLPHQKIPRQILKLTKGHNVSITMGSKGSYIVSKTKNEMHFVPAFTNIVVDTMSAGDAYFIISALMLYSTKSLKLASFSGNLAGAQTVGVEGCVPIDKSEFIQSLNSYLKIN